MRGIIDIKRALFSSFVQRGRCERHEFCAAELGVD